MQQTLPTWLKRAAAATTMAIMLAMPTAQVLAATQPDIYWSYVTPTSFNPSNNETVKIYWYITNGDVASMEIEIFNGLKTQGGTKVMDLIGPNPVANVPNPVVWTGVNNNAQIVPNGTYYYYVTVWNSAGSDEWAAPITVTGGGNNNCTTPALSDDKVVPGTFDPNSQSTTFSYDLNTEADVWVTIKNGSNQTVRQLYKHETNGGNDLPQVWDGRNSSNQIVAEGTYSYSVFASNTCGNDTETGTVTVDYVGGGNSGTAPVIGSSVGNDSDDYASPNPFDPNTQTTNIFYSLNTEADVWISIKDPSTNQTVEQVYQHQTAGNRSQVWDGKNASNAPFPEKVYNYEIFASNSSGSNTETGTVEVKYVGGTGTTPVIGSSNGNDSGDYASPNPFDPNKETTTIFYTLNTAVDSVSVQILDNGTTIETVTGGKNSGANTAVWDGRNSSNQPFAEKVYTYRITATNSAGSNTEEGTVEIDYESVNTNAPQITEHYPSPYEFDPAAGETTDIFFRLDKSANVTVEILSGNTVVKTVTNGASANAGLSFVEWNGRNNSNSIVSDAIYTYRITACDKVNTTQCNVKAGNVSVNEDGGSTGTMQITNDFADPERFNPDDENTHVYFTINKDAKVTVIIRDDNNNLVRTLLDETNRNQGSHSVTWNGEDRYGDEVDEGDYTYRITACAQNNTNDCDTETGNIEVDYDADNTDDLISDLHVNNAVFDPTEGEKAEVCFDIEKDDTEITIEILDGNTVIETIVDGTTYDASNNRCFKWNGEDEDNDIVDDDVYQFRVRAERGNDTEVQYAYTEVDTDGIIIGFPDDSEYCGGFYDVPRTSPFCKAIELMKFRGIFNGYPDGTFRPYADINRAEAVKVILLSLDYGILSDDGSNLGYWDVQRGAWYMPYLRTAQREGVATGYPDRSFRPAGTINRVELLRVFLEGSNINVPYCNTQPYPDTPINYETRWYIDYACFAKAYGLMGTDSLGNFNPAQPMSRADVAMLFYQFEKRGLFAGYNPGYYNNYYDNFNPYYYYTPGYYYDTPYYY